MLAYNPTERLSLSEIKAHYRIHKYDGPIINGHDAQNNSLIRIKNLSKDHRKTL